MRAVSTVEEHAPKTIKSSPTSRVQLPLEGEKPDFTRTTPHDVVQELRAVSTVEEHSPKTIKSSPTSRVQLPLEGEMSDFNQTKRHDFVNAIAGLLEIDRQFIRILHVNPGSGSIRVVIELPFDAAIEFVDLFQAKSERAAQLLHQFSVKSIRILEREEPGQLPPQQSDTPVKRRFDLTLFKTVSFWSTIGLSLVVLVLYVLSRPEIHLLPTPGLLELLEAKTLDLRFRLRGEIEQRENIVIIAVDEKTEDELGRWQSSGRQWLAKLLNILQEGNAKVVGFDLTLAEPNEGVNLNMLDKLKEQYQEYLPEAISNYPNILTYLDTAKVTQDYDLQLANAIQQAGNVVLGIYFFFDESSTAYLTPETHTAYRQRINRIAYETFDTAELSKPPLRLSHSLGVEPNLPAFSEAAKSLGHFNHIWDRDGYIRFSSLLIEYGGDYYPSLALEVAREYLNPPLAPIIRVFEKKNQWDIDTIELGKILIPTDEKGKLFINFSRLGRLCEKS